MTTDRTNGEPSLIRRLVTGVPGLDAVLGGGLPEYSFNLIVGAPGAGKTTLVQQIAFANATAERPALYFTVLGESTLKMLRYQRQFAFFKPELVESAIRFVNLSKEAVQGDLSMVLERIVREVEQAGPQIVVVDSFRSLAPHLQAETTPAEQTAAMGMEHFIQRLALHLATWEVTSFLVGEYSEQEQRNPIFTVADGILWLSQAIDRNSTVRKLQVTKVRGQAPMPGLHTFRITERGLQIFPRIPEQQRARQAHEDVRLSTGVPGLDEMMGGGIPAGDAVMLVGPAGTGKTTFATQFAAAGLRRGEAGVVVVFEEYPEEYLARARKLDVEVEEKIRAGRLRVIYLRPLDLSVDETLAEIVDGVQELDAAWVVIDSLSGFEIALAPTFREDFRESLYRLVGALTTTGVTVMMTSEMVSEQGDVRFTSERVSFLTDDIIAQRYVEIDGELRTVLTVVKMRGSQHSREFRAYEITSAGAVVGETLKNYHGIMTGIPDLQPRARRPGYVGLTTREADVLDTLIRLRSASLETLATHTGVSRDEMAQMFVRLVELGYALGVEEDGDMSYRALAQMSDQ